MGSPRSFCQATLLGILVSVLAPAAPSQGEQRHAAGDAVRAAPRAKQHAAPRASKRGETAHATSRETGGKARATPRDRGDAMRATPGDASESGAQTDAKLKALRARIAELAQQSAQELARRDAASADLCNAELAIPAQREALAALQRERAELEQHRAQLAHQRDVVGSQLQTRRGELESSVRAAYRLSREPRLKLLLAEQDAATAGRMLAYHAYLGRAQLAQIHAIQDDLARVQALDQDIAQQGARLAALNDEAAAKLAALEQARSQRVNALAAINRRVEDSQQRMERLKREQAALETLLANLDRIEADFNLGSRKPFATMQGRLPWPVSGKLAARFQESRGGGTDSGVKWNGILIDAPAGAKVRVPYYGRVVYSDWLQGLGLLLIVEHGEGYMTLFGRAEALYKRVGDTVAPGDVVAALGGGASQLYFEIRRGRTALDPQRWLAARR